MTDTESQPEPVQPEQKSKRSRFGCILAAMLLLLLYTLSDPWVIFGLYNLSPTLPDRVRPVYVVFYAPLHFMANHSDRFREMYQWYFGELQRLFPSYFDFASFNSRHSVP
jgi:hypothetical protein